MSRKNNTIDRKMIDILDEKSFKALEKLGIKFFRDKKTGKRLRVIKHQCQQ